MVRSILINSELKNILFVDDEVEILKNYQDYFSTVRGFQVVIASNPDRALLLAANQTFDIICTDFRMPKMTGGDFVNVLRGIKGYQTTPVIVITAYAEEAKKACEKLSGIYILAKPVKLQSVCEMAMKLAKLPSPK